MGDDIYIQDREIPQTAIVLAEKRTAGLFRQMQYGPMSMRNILASAHLQGMADMFQALEARGLVRRLPKTK